MGKVGKRLQNLNFLIFRVCSISHKEFEHFNLSVILGGDCGGKCITWAGYALLLAMPLPAISGYCDYFMIFSSRDIGNVKT